MASANIKDVQKQLDVISSRSKAIENEIKKLEAAKKDKEKKTASESLLKQINQSIPLVQKLEDKLCKAKKHLEGSTQVEEDEEKKRQRQADDSELTYELKAQIMKNVQVQNDRLKTELTLQERMKELKLANQQNTKLQEECNLSRTNSIKLVNSFEKKAKEANKKLEAMEEELKKSQELTNRYRDLYESERQKQREKGGKSGSKDEPITSARDTKTSSKTTPVKKENPHVREEQPDSPLGSGVRVEDIVRKNECLSKENQNLHRDIKDLRKENNDLLKTARESTKNRDSLLHQLDTSEKSRQELAKKLQKERTQKQRLEQSMTKQASDWIQRKKQVQQYEDEYRYGQIGHVSTQGAEERSKKT